ncbi:MAG TPA: ATPase, T2SS/T4P/T4SS family, partial [Candidatus Eisenbacteria bacterium]|nr:ATPase, T2SS/T4P/T4SS family [Candidatus Eisenbacteria bacterium]
MTLDLPALLKATLEAGGSDLHLATGQPPLVRLRGKMVRSQAPPLADAQARDLIFSVMTDDHRRAFDAGSEIDFAFELPGLARFRANVFRQRHGISAVYRVIITKIRTLDELGTPPILRELAMKDRGLVLVTGPTGSGKSTTLAAMIDYVNENRQGHIITIEDPIEFVHESKKCLVQQRE